MNRPDAVVIGSGPNGLAAAITLARAGRSVIVFEAADTLGGGARSAELTLPGFTHDICSAVHPLGRASQVFRDWPLHEHGLEWIEPPASLAHPFDDGRCALLLRSLDGTADRLGRDGPAYRTLVGSIVHAWPRLEANVLGPFGIPRHPFALASFGLRALRSAEHVARSVFREEQARALFAGSCAHGMLALDRPLSAGFGLVLSALAHLVGWPIARGGSQRLSNALASYLRSLGGEIVTGSPVASIDDLPPARVVLCDLAPKPLLQIAGHRFPAWYRRRLERYRHRMAAFKVDFALDGPIPWRAAECAQAATVHLGGTLDEIGRSERDAWDGRTADRPFVLLAQPSLFDPARAPAGRHTAWAYCHVPLASNADMLSRIEDQIERFAPGFRDRVLARSVLGPADLERHNANLVSGDISGGAVDAGQLFTRPTWRTYSTPLAGVYICSASTPPGGGVHGLCGYFAAHRALDDVLRD
ncbi:MAG TPA: NAD(P)/FAD-dependent oxidoreductase [Vicinamibacterales bacterium]|nr:NAD(P)/FAD-dependent oxidoreductase [Vicinamibacterales bacterium]